MEKLDLAKYSLSELNNLHIEIDKAANARQQEDVTKAREQILAIAQGLGLSVQDLISSAPAKSKAQSASKVQPLYKNPADASHTWSGRGRQPRWVAEALANGKTLHELKI